MPRYIDANALQSNMMEMVASGLYGLEDMIDAVIEAPTVSPDEVRGVGTWLRKEKVRRNLDGDGDYRYECSACGHSDEHNENVHVPFCWYCGAKMEV